MFSPHQQGSYGDGNGSAGTPVVVQGTVVDAPGSVVSGIHQPFPHPSQPQQQPQPLPHVSQQQPQQHPYSASAYNYTHASTNYVQQVDENQWTKGEKQPKRCNDVAFAIMFYAHLAVMAWVAAAYVPQMSGSVVSEYGGRFLQENGNGNDVNYGDISLILVVTGLFGLFASILSLSFMMIFAEGLIKIALFFNIVVSLLMGISGLITGVIPLAIMGFISCALSAYYTYVVWQRIPFAAQNLITATTAVRQNFGLNFIAYISLFFMLGWTFWWSASFVSTMYITSGCNAAGVCDNEPNGIVVFLFLVSYFWVHQVLKNIVHVTVAGTVGTWWFAPLDAGSCCSSAVRDSFVRSVTFSFGSICFGSLIVAIIQATKEIVRQMREQDDGILLCCAECLIGCLEYLAEYFNKWAFVYVGLYGYNFIESGKNVMTLFKARGWTTLITDNLVGNVLFMVSAGVGLVTGLIGIILANMKGLGAEFAGGAFAVGFVVGLVMTSVLMGVVESAVNTVIVCYAEGPNEFQANHPQLSENMREKWSQAWPLEFRY